MQHCGPQASYCKGKWHLLQKSLKTTDLSTLPVKPIFFPKPKVAEETISSGSLSLLPFSPSEVSYEAESKYRLRIFPLQRWGREFAHARCLPSFTRKIQTPIWEKQIAFTYCSVRLKCSRRSSAPSTVKYGYPFFECKKCETGWYSLSDMWSICRKCHEWWNGERMG